MLGYMVLCNLNGGSEGDVAVMGNENTVADDCHEIIYENGYDDFAMVML